MASVSKCGSVRLVSDDSAFMGSGMEHREVFLKPWSSSSQFRAMVVVEVKSRTTSGFRISRHFSIRKKEVAKKVEETIAKSYVEKGITKVAFDRGCYPYHGSIEALDAAARQHGLQSYAFVSFWEI